MTQGRNFARIRGMNGDLVKKYTGLSGNRTHVGRDGDPLRALHRQAKADETPSRRPSL